MNLAECNSWWLDSMFCQPALFSVCLCELTCECNNCNFKPWGTSVSMRNTVAILCLVDVPAYERMGIRNLGIWLQWQATLWWMRLHVTTWEFGAWEFGI